MAYLQNGVDINTKPFYDYGEGYSPRVNFSNYFTGEGSLGIFSFRSKADEYNPGIEAETVNYNIDGKSYDLIKKGCFPTWTNNFIDLSQPGTYRLITDGENYLDIFGGNADNSVSIYNRFTPTQKLDDDGNWQDEAVFRDGIIPRYIIAEIQGAGGGGGAAANSGSTGSGGGSGGYAQVIIELPIVTDTNRSPYEATPYLEIKVGAGGVGGGGIFGSTIISGMDGAATIIKDSRAIDSPYTNYTYVEVAGGKGGVSKTGFSNNSNGGAGALASDNKLYHTCSELYNAGGGKGGDNSSGGMPYYPNGGRFYISNDSNYRAHNSMYRKLESSIFKNCGKTYTETTGSSNVFKGGGGAGTDQGKGGNAGTNPTPGYRGGGGGGSVWSNNFIISTIIPPGAAGGDGYVKLWY